MRSAEVVALDEFHHEGLDATGVLEPVNGCDVRVIQAKPRTSASR